MLPNIYKGNYKLLAIAPLLLILISLFFIPSIKMGVDFQGGTMITLSMNKSVDAQALQNQLAAEGIQATVQVFPTTMGYKAEIEVPQDKDLVKAEDLKTAFNDLLPGVERLEVETYQNSSYSQQYAEQTAKLDNISDQMFSLAGENRADMNISGTNQLQQDFTDAYNSIYTNYEESVTGPLQKLVNYNSISVEIVSPTLSETFLGSIMIIAVWAALF